MTGKIVRYSKVFVLICMAIILPSECLAQDTHAAQEKHIDFRDIVTNEDDGIDYTHVVEENKDLFKIMEDIPEDQKAIEFAKRYRPFEKFPDDIYGLCDYYARNSFFDTVFKRIVAYPNDDKWMVSFEYFVGKPEPAWIKHTIPSVQERALKLNGQISFMWIADLENKTLTPFNLFAEDVIKEMGGSSIYTRELKPDEEKSKSYLPLLCVLIPLLVILLLFIYKRIERSGPDPTKVIMVKQKGQTGEEW